ncbi:hypothetical protein GPALN_010319 [Globodera pallida]|nr:hypothetical protein GPALN_010319 [Globodera pallida]
MAIYSYFIVFYCFLFFSTRVFLAESSGEVVSLSSDQINLFLENMDTFLSSKCKFSKDESARKGKKLKKCLFELNVAKMREIFKQSDGNGANSMEIDQQQSPPTMTANAFMEMILTKMVAELLHIPILHQSEQSVLLDQQLSNLTPEQNLSIVLELFYVANNFGNIFLNKLKRDERRKMTGNFGSFRLINLGYYKEMMRKFEFAVEFKRSAPYC